MNGRRSDAQNQAPVASLARGRVRCGSRQLFNFLYRKPAKRAGNMREPVMAIVGNSPHLGGAMSIADFSAWAGIGRTTAWKEIKEGRSRAIKVSACTLIASQTPRDA